MTKQRGLGKGLGALLGESAMQPSTQQSPLLLPLQKIEPNRLQPRKSFNEEELAALQAKIAELEASKPQKEEPIAEEEPAERVCPVCGVTANSKFCPECGAPMGEPKE